MRVLFIDPPFQRFMGFHRYYYPLGLASMASVLRQAGHDVMIYDADRTEKADTLSWSAVADHHNHYLRGLSDQKHPVWAEAEAVIRDFDPQLVGITALSVKALSAARMARICKRVNPNVVVVVGGDHPTVFPEQFLRNPDIDLVVRGEGETTMAELANCLERKHPKGLGSVAGLSYRAGREAKHNPNRALIENLDELPFPAIDALMDAPSYRPIDFGAIMASRGCPYDCTFCGVANVWTRRTRHRSPASVVSEIKWLKETYGTNYFSFRDASFTVNRRRVMQLCREITANHLRIQWECLTRADLLDHELVDAMTGSGCVTVRLGVESGSERILRHMKKEVSLDAVRQAAKLLQERNIYWAAYILLGTPRETKESVRETVDLIREIDPPFVTLARFAPIPGTEMYDELAERNMISPDIDWSMECNQRYASHYVYAMGEAEFEKVMRETAAFVETHNSAKSAALGQRDHRLK